MAVNSNESFPAVRFLKIAVLHLPRTMQCCTSTASPHSDYTHLHYCQNMIMRIFITTAFGEYTQHLFLPFL